MYNIQNYGMTNYQLGFQASPKSLELIKNKKHILEQKIAAYKERLLEGFKDKHSEETTKRIIDTYEKQLKKILAEEKLIKSGYSQEEIDAARRIEPAQFYDATSTYTQARLMMQEKLKNLRLKKELCELENDQIGTQKCSEMLAEMKTILPRM